MHCTVTLARGFLSGAYAHAYAYTRAREKIMTFEPSRLARMRLSCMPHNDGAHPFASVKMSFSPFSLSTRLSERLTPAKTRELADLLAKSEHPQPSAAVVNPLLELVRYFS